MSVSLGCTRVRLLCRTREFQVCAQRDLPYPMVHKSHSSKTHPFLLVVCISRYWANSTRVEKYGCSISGPKGAPHFGGGSDRLSCRVASFACFATCCFLSASCRTKNGLPVYLGPRLLSLPPQPSTQTISGLSKLGHCPCYLPPPPPSPPPPQLRQYLDCLNSDIVHMTSPPPSLPQLGLIQIVHVTSPSPTSDNCPCYLRLPTPNSDNVRIVRTRRAADIPLESQVRFSTIPFGYRLRSQSRFIEKRSHC